MTRSTYFVQECPTCGRDLEIRVEFLGRAVSCQHCGGRFEARDPQSAAARNTASSLLNRADELLQRASHVHSPALRTELI
jgi:hypothetical protein